MTEPNPTLQEQPISEKDVGTQDIGYREGKLQEPTPESENLEWDNNKDQQQTTSQSQRLVEAARAALLAAAAVRDEQTSKDVEKESSYEFSTEEATPLSHEPHLERVDNENEGNQEQVGSVSAVETSVVNENINEGAAKETAFFESSDRIYTTSGQIEGTEEPFSNENSNLDNLCSIAAICGESNASPNTCTSPSRPVSEKKFDTSSNSSSTRDTSSHIIAPKSASNRPADSRVFIGNLASERTTVAELVSIFSKYGNLTEEPVIRRSFGFVQYDNAESAYRAIEAEQGRVIGGMPIDLSLADNRDSRRTSRTQSGVGPDRSRKNFSERFNPYDHSARLSSTSRSARHSRGNSRRPRRFDSRNGVAVRILVLGQQARGYAHSCEATIRAFLGLQTDVVYIEASKLGDSLELAKEQLVPYVIVVNSKDEREGSCSLRILDSEGYQKVKGGSLPFREVLNIVVEEEDLEQQVIMNMNALAPFASGVDMTSPSGYSRNNTSRSGNARAARDSLQSISQSSASFPTYSNSTGNTQAWPLYGAVSSNSAAPNINSFGLPSQPSSLLTMQNPSLNPQQQQVSQTLGYPQNQVSSNIGISHSNPYASLLNSLSMLQQSQNSSQTGIPSSGQYAMPNVLSSGQQNVDLAKIANTLSSLSQLQQQQAPPIGRPSNYPQTAVSSGYNIANMLQSLQNGSLSNNVSTGIPSVSSPMPGSSSANVPTNLLQLLQQAQAHVAMAQQQQQQQQQQSHPSQNRR